MHQLLVLSLVLLTASAQAGAYLAIIIDDLGNDYRHAQAVLQLPVAVTVSILPRLVWSRKIARLAHLQGRESMLHQPMASLAHRSLGPGGLMPVHTRTDIEAILDANLASVPYVSGINNHMGSLLTSEQENMAWFMAALKAHGDLYFIDSRTSATTQAAKVAQAMDVANASRDVFLDNTRDVERIRHRLLEAVKLARLKGTAIAIGHPYPETVAVLAKEIPRIRERGIELVPVSRVIAQQRSSKTWHVSSSPLHKVAKNSKP